MGRKAKRKPKLASQAPKISSNPSKYSILKSPIVEAQAGSPRPIRITQRLGLPAFQSSEPEPSSESELQLEFRPRTYFASGLCQLCSQRCGALEFPCEGCHMVYYCSAQHREQQLAAHRELCAVLSRVGPGALALARGLAADEYRALRVELLAILQAGLGRGLELWERELVLYPRLCRVCHGSEDLQRCPDCGMEYFCSAEHRLGHADHCAEFRVFREILETQRERPAAAPRIPDFRLEEGLPEDLDAAMALAFGRGYERIDCSSYAALSQAASPALTALYALHCLSSRNPNLLKRKSLKIHVIGAELQFECANLGVWEKLFLHLLPSLKSLRLEFCGPELQVPADIAEVLERPRLCASCRAKGCGIDVVFHCGKLYHQLETDRPDLVCLFNPGLYRTTGFANQDSWPPTIEKFCESGSPILLTSYTEIELPRDLARMREFRELGLELEPRRNPFASLRPERNFVSDDVAPLIYKNYYLSLARGVAASPTRAGRS